MRQSIHDHQHRSEIPTIAIPSHYSGNQILPFRLIALLLLITVTAVTLWPSRVHAAVAEQFIYHDSLAWENWSWRTSVNPSVSSPVLYGSKSLAVTYKQGWAGLSLYSAGGVRTNGLNSLEFSLNTSGEFPRIDVGVYNGNEIRRQVDAQRYATPTGSGWYSVTIPLADLGASDMVVHRIQLQEASGAGQPTFHIDDLGFTSSAARAAATLVSAPAQAQSYSSVSSGTFRPAEASAAIDEEIRKAAERYNLPRWFYYAVIQRESSFNRFEVNSNGDKGLTQLGGIHYKGTNYPENLRLPNDNHTQYAYDMGFDIFGRWITMSKVTPMTDPFDTRQNLDRFSTGYAVPAFNLFKKRYGLSDTETLRAVAFHWNKGLFVKYDKYNKDYLGLYDKYVGQYKPAVEREDGMWNGRPYIP